MEYCALGDLSQFIKRRDTLAGNRYTREMMSKYPNPPGGALNEVVVRHFLKQLASALHFLRDRNLIHRDIKPQNLLLCPAPSSYRTGVARIIPYKGSEDSYDPTTGLESLPMLKIADFGFARSLPATSLAETLCGSPLYMAPEILRYEKYDAKADLWSVGTVLYEMVVGRPPFRATNHVELLRKIEKGEDRLRFPDDNPASEDIKKLIRGLLKRNPVERLNFSDFFNNSVITDVIPGLVADDTPRGSRRSSVEMSRTPGPYQTASRQVPGNQPDVNPGRDSPYTADQEEPTTSPTSHRPPDTYQKTGTPPSAQPMRRMGSADRPASGPKEQPRDTKPNRPSPISRATAPGREELVDRQPPPAAIDRQRSQNTYSRSSRPADDRAQEERERAAQEVAFERDYVVVEKRAVEVNAFADELAHSPRIQGGFARGQAGSLPRRATAQGLSSTSPRSKAMQVVPSRARADSTHQRQHSYERRYGQSPTSATSAISKALNMASGRLFGTGFSPPLTIAKGGRSPPLAYNPFPAYPAAQASLMLMGDGQKSNAVVDEDCKTVQVIEECATRSDVVYGFAEVKYKQLIPLAPSAPSDPSARPMAGPDTDNDSGDDGLTVDAIVTLSEEALVLYVKALSLLAKSMDIAGAWWSRKNREDTYGDSSTRGDGTSALACTRINNVVQWVRSRFNEVLEKAEFVRLKLIESQKRLPIDHPSHPDNHSIGSTAASYGSADVVVGPGVTAEKLMYDRALEMSRAAAISELTGDDLAGCEIAYVTAIRMLEAVFEDDALRSTTGGTGERQGTPQADEKVPVDGLQGEDRQVVVKRKLSLLQNPAMCISLFLIVVSSMRGRLTALRKKLAVLSKRTSAPTPVMGTGRTHSSNLVPVSHATGATPPR